MTPAEDAEGKGQLFVVSTPIGNMGDFSFRAVDTLRAVSVVLAEDTRHSRHLLDRYAIGTPLQAYHEHNEAKTAPALVNRMLAGERFALISDAGTPLLSDPGGRLVRAALDAGIDVIPIPGASALLAALVASGLDATRFTFFGFAPRKGKERAALLREVVALGHTAVLYEAPSRVGETLAELTAAGAGRREAAVARELTKHFEDIRRGTVSDLSRYYADVAPRGEVVLLVGGAAAVDAPDEAVARERARELRTGGASARDVVAALMAEFQLARNAAYRIAQEAVTE